METLLMILVAALILFAIFNIKFIKGVFNDISKHNRRIWASS